MSDFSVDIQCVLRVDGTCFPLNSFQETLDVLMAKERYCTSVSTTVHSIVHIVCCTVLYLIEFPCTVTVGWLRPFCTVRVQYGTGLEHVIPYPLSKPQNQKKMLFTTLTLGWMIAA